ncbi:MAG: hypothetical protein ABIY70_00450 [Capsulimonas sp.]|uniref:hypothetical protein n=1 Tax=Capsulimonas sp. TaxID=2494211 RepID=UPI003267D23F
MYSFTFRSLALVSLGVLIVPAAQAASHKPAVKRPAPPTAHRILLPEYTPVRLRLMQDLKSGDTPEGEIVAYEVVQNVYAPGHILVIPAGAKAFGRVLASKSHNSIVLPGRLSFTCNYILAPDQTRVPVRAGGVAKGTLGMKGLAADPLKFTGGVVNFALKGGEISVSQGQMYLGYIDQPTTLFPAPLETKGVANGFAANETIFTLNNGAEVQGKLVSFDGRTYKVQTDAKMETLAAENVASTRRVKPGAREYVPDSPQAVRGGPEIEGLPRPVEITRIDAKVEYGMLLGYDGYIYVLNTFDTVKMLEADDVQSVHFQGGVHKKHGPLHGR